MSFSKNLVYLRKSKKLSQEDLAFKLGVSRQAVSKWESGAAYPETEKILAICKLFDCSLDELMKDNIAELREDEVKKYTFNDLVKEVSSLVKRTANIFSGMNRRALLKFLFEIVILFVFVALILKIPFGYIESLGYNLGFTIGGKTGNVLGAIWKFLSDIVYFITSVILFLSIYKIRFLDKIDVAKEKIIPGEEAEKIEEEKHEEAVKHDFGILSLIGKIFIVGIKVLIGILSLFIICFLLFFTISLVVVTSWMFEGVFHLGLIIFLVFGLLLFSLALYVNYNFIVNRRSKWSKVFSILLLSLFGLGAGMGIEALEMKDFTLTSSPHEYIIKDKKEEIFNMTDSLVIEDLGYRGVEYIEDEKLSDKVKIEILYYSDFMNVEILQEDNEVLIKPKQDDVPFYKIYGMLIEDLKEKTLHIDYQHLFNYETKVYTSRENIAKIQENFSREEDQVDMFEY